MSSAISLLFQSRHVASLGHISAGDLFRCGRTIRRNQQLSSRGSPSSNPTDIGEDAGSLEPLRIGKLLDPEHSLNRSPDPRFRRLQIPHGGRTRVAYHPGSRTCPHGEISSRKAGTSTLMECEQVMVPCLLARSCLLWPLVAGPRGSV